MDHDVMATSIQSSPLLIEKDKSASRDPRLTITVTPMIEKTIPIICLVWTFSFKNKNDNSAINAGVGALIRAAFIDVV